MAEREAALRLRSLVAALGHRGRLVLAARATRDPQRDLDEPYSLQWGCDQEDRVEGVVSAYASDVVVDATTSTPSLLVSEEQVSEIVLDLVDEVEDYWDDRGGLADDQVIAVYLARRADSGGPDGENYVTPLALVEVIR